jgi:NAD(P)-dependent dehydrogenase (short-subunit alcohol dehydrogenase family)
VSRDSSSARDGLRGAVALVTGANGGLGRELVAALLRRGAGKVYAASRGEVDWGDARIVPLRLDVTDPLQVASAAEAARDTMLLVNNAGVNRNQPLLRAPHVEGARAEMETNYFGTLAMCRAFAPVLAGNGGGAIVNVLSALSWVSFPSVATYSASKSAAWSLTNGLRNELRAQGTQVVALHVGYMDTDMTRGLDAPKSSPADVARVTLEGVEAGAFEVLADDISRQIKQSLSSATPAYAA